MGDAWSRGRNDARKEDRETAALLAQHAYLMNRHGPDSPEASLFVAQHLTNTEFVELSQTARSLKKALEKSTDAND